jgi:hypothetical protein
MVPDAGTPQGETNIHNKDHSPHRATDGVGVKIESGRVVETQPVPHPAPALRMP